MHSRHCLKRHPRKLRASPHANLAPTLKAKRKKKKSDIIGIIAEAVAAQEELDTAGQHKDVDNHCGESIAHAVSVPVITEVFYGKRTRDSKIGKRLAPYIAHGFAV
jgi:hypothetical protein